MANKMRPKKVTFRMTEEEYEKLLAKVEESGKNQQEYILACVLGKEVYNTDGLVQLITEVNRVGNNLNQVARLLNTSNLYGGYVDSRTVNENQKEVNQLWQSLRRYLQRLQ